MDEGKQLPMDDWNDQDLLTKVEARERLVDEIGRTETELDLAKAATPHDSAVVGLLERRLNAMRSICSEYDVQSAGE